MISIARIFGAPVIEPPGKVARRRSTGRSPRARRPFDRGDEVMHGRVALDLAAAEVT